MRRAKIEDNFQIAGVLTEVEPQKHYVFEYDQSYAGQGVSLTMPKKRQLRYEFTQFPPFFEGLLPEGLQLESLLRTHKIDRNDLFSQLLAVGADTVGAITISEIS